jgi:hypothetical protein
MIGIISKQMERTCKKCGETKPIEEFGKNHVNNREYISHICKICTGHRMKKWRKDNYKEIRRYRIQYDQNHYDIIKNQKSIWEKNNHTGNPDHLRKRKDDYHSNKNGQKERQSSYCKSLTDSLDDQYIIACIKQNYRLERETIKEYPEFIESYRQQIKVKRLIKTKKDESTKTS